MSFLRTVSAFTRRLETSPLPIVAVLHGHAVAGGLELALACDVVVAEAGTLIGDGHIRNNLLPGAGASVRLRARLGDALARWLALTGELLPAEKFLSAGWLHAVVDSGHGATEGQRLAEILAAAADPAQSAYKRLLRRPRRNAVPDGRAGSRARRVRPALGQPRRPTCAARLPDPTGSRLTTLKKATR